jgi:hypothetical protein
MIATNAEPIIAARLKGRKPADLIRVSLVGTICHGNHVVYAQPENAYDWRWCKDLDICLHIGATPDWAHMLKSIALQRPAHLSIWNTYEQWGAKVYLVPTVDDLAYPVKDWLYELDFLPWLDFQNDDFLTGRTYARDAKGMPYATH